MDVKAISMSALFKQSEDIYTDASTYYFDQEKKDIPVPDRHSFLEDIIER